MNLLHPIREASGILIRGPFAALQLALIGNNPPFVFSDLKVVSTRFDITTDQ